ncbi:unnamed protein product [Pleuronectes platessa]|uniref:Uncharacterized protein n=1 Tax=Pleuronectes platessa TaxID=8262 RepID=A0A9N7YGE5_PLEPL|nr:unnamed protein product [Pleuronectes platessa]
MPTERWVECLSAKQHFESQDSEDHQGSWKDSTPWIFTEAFNVVQEGVYHPDCGTTITKRHGSTELRMRPPPSSSSSSSSQFPSHAHYPPSLRWETPRTIIRHAVETQARSRAALSG